MTSATGRYGGAVPAQTGDGRTSGSGTADAAPAPHVPAGLDGLRFGVATSAYQIEGDTTTDGRGPSIWDTFAARPGTIADGSDGAVACGSYRRWPDDLALLRELGVGVYRFSVAWPRIQPDGAGPANAAGLGYYDRMVDDLLAAGIEPMVTLYHWDLPQALEDAGGWPVRGTADRFADYASLVATRLADRVQLWATLNEPWCSAFEGYASGRQAPGRREPDAAYAAAHHLLLGHAGAASVLRAARPAAEVGIVLNLVPVQAYDEAGVPVARMVDAIHNRLWLDALTRGDYPEELSDWLADPGLVRHGDLEAIAGSAHWLGVNYYTPYRVSGPGGAAATADTDDDVDDDLSAYPGAPAGAFHRLAPRSTMRWEIDAAGLERLLARVRVLAPGLPVRITENGIACPDTARTADGTIDDADRIAYLHDHLAALGRAREAGSDVRDYLVWTLMDNFEWAHGYRQRFGLAEIVPDTLARRPKRSFRWYAALLAAQGARHTS